MTAQRTRLTQILLLFCLFLAVLLASGPTRAVARTSASSRYAITGTIQVGKGAWKAAVDPVSHHVFVANDGDGSVSIVDGQTNRVTGTVVVGGNPHGVAVDSRTGRAWVTNQQGAQVDAIDTTTGSHLGFASTSETTPFGSGATTEGVAVDSANSVVYTSDANPSAGQTSAVSEGTMALIRKNVAVTDDPGPTGAQPHGLAFDAGRGLLFTANIGNDTLSVIKAKSGTPINVIDLSPYGAGPEAVYYEASTNRIFVAMWSSAGATGADAMNGQLLVLDGSTFKKIAIVRTDVDPSDIAADPSDHAIFVANQASGSNSLGAPGSLLVFDDHTLKLEQRVLTPSAAQSVGVAVDPQTHTVYVVNSATTTGGPGSVSVVNLVIDSGPGTISFGSSTASALAGSKATISVVRTGNTNLVSTVRYATSNGTARAGRDYVKTAGTVRFAKGARLARFTVPTKATTTKASSLTFRLVLSHPTGGALKAPTTATVTIAEKAAPRLTAVPTDATISTTKPYTAAFAATARPAASFKVSSGALPKGLSLGLRTGKLSGTAKVGGTFGFRVTASNGIGKGVTSGVVTLTVYKPPTFTAATPPTELPVNVNWLGYLFKVDEYPVNTSAFAVTSGAIPTGMTMNGGYLFGIPTVPGTYHFKLTATNPYIGPSTTTPTITMTINP